MDGNLTKKEAIEKIEEVVKTYTEDFTITLFKKKVKNKATIEFFFVVKVLPKYDGLFEDLMKLEKRENIRAIESELSEEKGTVKEFILVSADVGIL